MDEIEIKRLYFALITEARPEKREEAADKLSKSGNPDLMQLAVIGQKVFSVISDQAEPGALREVVGAIDTLPDADYWLGFAETTGQVVLLKALSMDEGSRSRSELLWYGLQIVSKSFGSGFPISPETRRLVNKAKDADPKTAERADAILRRDEMLSPHSLEKLSRKTDEKPGRRRREKTG
jgi:hypothetical protein